MLKVEKSMRKVIIQVFGSITVGEGEGGKKQPYLCQFFSVWTKT
jgi:hypothetical protein